MKRYLRLVVIIVVVIMAAFVFAPQGFHDVHKTDKANDYNFVYDRFHLKLPQDTIPLLSLESSGKSHGDGYHLRIFGLSPAGQEYIMQQSYFASWSQLPMDSALQDEMTSLLQVDGLIERVDLEGLQGFYIILSRNYGYALNEQNNKGSKKQNSHEAFNMDEDLWRNIAFAVLDTDHQQLIIYTWDS